MSKEIIQSNHHDFPGEDTKAELLAPTERAAVTPMQLLEMAMSQNADLAKLEKLMDLQERWEKKEAQKAFVVAMNAFKAAPPTILKSHKAAFPGKSGGTVTYDYATLNDVCDQITEGLGKHGVSHRWKIEQPDKSLVRVTCILTHEMGHSEETTLSAGPDETGSKNAIQSIGSAVTYLQRYTLLAATGLAAGNGDNDASSSPKMEKLNEYIEAIGKAPNLTALKTLFEEAYKKATEAKDQAAQKTLIIAKDAKKAILERGAA